MPREFKTVGLWGRLSEQAVAEPALQVLKQLKKRGVQLFASIESDGNDAFGEATRVAERDLVPAVDLVVAVGGDGTLLHAARHVAGRDVPLLGVNRGRLGFLTDISPEHMLQAIDAILAGDYLSEYRPLLAAKLAARAAQET